jgi:hypothetical protein
VVADCISAHQKIFNVVVVQQLPEFSVIRLVKVVGNREFFSMAVLMVFEVICLYYQLRRFQSTNNRDCFVAFGLSQRSADRRSSSNSSASSGEATLLKVRSTAHGMGSQDGFGAIPADHEALLWLVILAAAGLLGRGRHF